jgi:kynureninase
VIPGLADHYTRFRVSQRLLLTGHSHQCWPDVAFDGIAEAFEDAATHVDDKWERAFAKAGRVRQGYRTLLGDPGAEIALGANTHELLIRFLSALSLRQRPRVITTNGEFHSLRRQLGRLGEEGLHLVQLPARPVADLAERLAATIDDRTAAVLVSAVLYEDSQIVPGLDELARACAAGGVELLIDAYHALGAVPFAAPPTAWVVGGGYKYLQLGEGNCFLRVPEHAWESRPVITGWYAEFEAMQRTTQNGTPYPTGAAAFAGATYDPTSHYRAARVLDFFAEHGLTPEMLRDSYQHQLAVLAAAFDRLGAPDDLITRDRETPLSRFGGFLALRSPRSAALHNALAERGVSTDHRGEYLRLGPAPYLSDAQLERAIAELGAAIGS